MPNGLTEEPSVLEFIYKNTSVIELVLLLVFFYITYLAVNDLRFARATLQWPKVEGKVKAINKVKKHFEDNLEMVYEYQVEEKKFENRIITIDEYLSKQPKGYQEVNDLVESPILTFLKNMGRVLNGKISNLTTCYHYLFSFFPIFTTERTEFISQYKPGDVIPIYYAPGKPEVALVKPGVSNPFYVILGFNAFIFLVILRNIVSHLFYVLGVTSILLKIVSIFTLLIWLIAPLTLFVYLTGMLHSIIKSMK